MGVTSIHLWQHPAACPLRVLMETYDIKLSTQAELLSPDSHFSHHPPLPPTNKIWKNIHCLHS